MHTDDLSDALVRAFALGYQSGVDDALAGLVAEPPPTADTAERVASYAVADG